MQLDNEIRHMNVMVLQKVNGVNDYVYAGRLVTGEMMGPHERDLRAVAACDLRDFLCLCRNYDAVQARAA